MERAALGSRLRGNDVVVVAGLLHPLEVKTIACLLHRPLCLAIGSSFGAAARWSR